MLVRKSVRRNRAVVLGALALATALGGCTDLRDGPTSSTAGPTGAAGSTQREPTLDPKIIALADPKVVSRPLAAYTFGPADQQTIDRAKALDASTCMRSFGLEAVDSWPSRPVNRQWSRYGLWDPASAQTGYMSPEDFQVDDSIRFTGEAAGVFQGAVKEYKGLPVPAGGCSGKASGDVMQGVSADLNALVGGLDREAWQRATQDSRVVPLFDAWRRCMKDAGWDYTDPQAPFQFWNQPPRRGTDKHVKLSSISNAEKASARDDLACKHSTSLLGTWLAADMAYQRMVIERESQRLAEWTKEMDKIRANANRIIAAGGAN